LICRFAPVGRCCSGAIVNYALLAPVLLDHGLVKQIGGKPVSYAGIIVGDIRQRAGSGSVHGQALHFRLMRDRYRRPGSAASSSSAVFARRSPARSPWCNGRPAPESSHGS
jgi:hypothetical protein